jgi:hypothetical protein
MPPKSGLPHSPSTCLLCLYFFFKVSRKFSEPGSQLPEFWNQLDFDPIWRSCKGQVCIDSLLHYRHEIGRHEASLIVIRSQHIVCYRYLRGRADPGRRDAIPGRARNPIVPGLHDETTAGQARSRSLLAGRRRPPKPLGKRWPLAGSTATTTIVPLTPARGIS